MIAPFRPTPMSIPGSRLLETARAGTSAVWVRVERVRGSAPREAGASMLVPAAGEPEGTIGGGNLEFDAIAHARRMLAGDARVAVRDVVLGASLGQCCGGAVSLSLRRIDAREASWIERIAALDDAGGSAWLETEASAAAVAPHTRVLDAPPAPEAPSSRDAPPARDADASADGVRPSTSGARLVSRIEAAPWHVWVFGAGHVGEAVVRVLATLPARVTWVDPREARFPADLPANVATLESDGPAHEVRTLPAGADALVMTHSHALDFDLCVALLARDDLGLVGLIGSDTKAASFRARLARRGLAPGRVARLACPVGVRPEADDARHPLDRHPGAIAVSVAFDLWRRRRSATPAASARTAGAAR
jgi:xanthine dehydrogenase accessory factor